MLANSGLELPIFPPSAALLTTQQRLGRTEKITSLPYNKNLRCERGKDNTLKRCVETRLGERGWEGLRRALEEVTNSPWALSGIWDLQSQSLSFTVSFLLPPQVIRAFFSLADTPVFSFTSCGAIFTEAPGNPDFSQWARLQREANSQCVSVLV